MVGLGIFGRMIPGITAGQVMPHHWASDALLHGDSTFFPVATSPKLAVVNFAGAGNLTASFFTAPTIFSGSSILAGLGNLNTNPRLIKPAAASLAGSGDFTISFIAFSAVLSNSAGGNDGYSIRNMFNNMAESGSQVRVTFRSGAGPTIINNVSIGKQLTNQQTVATPVELTFRGISGFSLTSGQGIVSDWANFAITAGDEVIVVQDYGAASQHAFVGILGLEEWFLPASATYNQANPSGVWTNNGTFAVLVEKIEVR